LGGWLQTAPGRYLLGWEQQRLDQAVADLFGYHALQMGLPALDGLRANRMPHRWVASPSLDPFDPLELPPPAADAGITTQQLDAPVAVHCAAEALPFRSASLDLVVMPHTLELAADPHQALAEAARVLMPEGRLVIVGLNPTSLWGLRQRAGRLRQQLNLGHDALYLPQAGEFIGYWRLRDWLRLLGFEIEGGRFGCYRPPLRSPGWLERFAWMERAGDRWWPVLGAVYFLVAVRRERGLRLVGRLRTERVPAGPAPAVVAHRQRRGLGGSTMPR